MGGVYQYPQVNHGPYGTTGSTAVSLLAPNVGPYLQDVPNGETPLSWMDSVIALYKPRLSALVIARFGEITSQFSRSL